MRLTRQLDEISQSVTAASSALSDTAATAQDSMREAKFVMMDVQESAQEATAAFILVSAVAVIALTLAITAILMIEAKS